MNPNSPKLSTSQETCKAEDERLRGLADLELVRGSLLQKTEDTRKLMGRLECVSSMLAAKNTRMGRPLDTSEIEDVVQEVLICIWKKREHFQGTGPLEAWAYRISSLEFMNRMRKKQRRIRLVGEIGDRDPSCSDPSPEPAPHDYETIHAGLELVGPPDADVVRLKHFESLTFAQIGIRLSIPANTAKTQYYRGLEKLRRHIQRSEIE